MNKSAPIYPAMMKALFIGSSAYKDASKVLSPNKIKCESDDKILYQPNGEI